MSAIACTPSYPPHRASSCGGVHATGHLTCSTLSAKRDAGPLCPGSAGATPVVEPGVAWLAPHALPLPYARARFARPAVSSKANELSATNDTTLALTSTGTANVSLNPKTDLSVHPEPRNPLVFMTRRHAHSTPGSMRQELSPSFPRARVPQRLRGPQRT